MNFHRRYSPGALALAVLVLSGLLPTFASPGVWVCPNGTACPWMNRQASSSTTASCPRLCCRCPNAAPSGVSVQVRPNCRFVSFARRIQPARVLPKARSVKLFAFFFVYRLPLEDFPVGGPPATAFPPAPVVTVPRSFLLSSTPARAPPIG